MTGGSDESTFVDRAHRKSEPELTFRTSRGWRLCAQFARSPQCELERQPQRQLPDAGGRPTKGAGCGDLAERRTFDVCRTVKDGRLSKLGMIQSVEEFGAKLHLEALRYGSGLGERNVEIGQGRTAEHISVQAVGSVGRVIHRIELRETGIGSASALKVRSVLEGHVGKAIGIKDKVAGDRLGRDLAAARGVGAVGDFIDCAHLPGVVRSDRLNHRGVRKDRIARP